MIFSCLYKPLGPLITGQDKLKKITIESCKKLYNLEITKENGMVVMKEL